MATLTQLKERALVRADFPALANVTFVTSGQLTDWVNMEGSKLHQLVINACEDYYLSTTTISLVSGTEAYALPADFLKALKVFWNAGGRRYVIERFMLEEVDGFSYSPVAGGSVELWYAPEYTNLVNDSDELGAAVAPGWEDYVVLGVSYRCLMKEHNVEAAQLIKQEQLEMEQRILGALPGRDLGKANRIADITGRHRTVNDLLFNEGRAIRYRIMGNYIRFLERVENPGA